jgi:type II secretory pathway pseudopilin PulG
LATSSWLPTTEAKRLVWAIRCAVLLGLLALIGSVVDKTLWDWLGLLIVPVVLAIGGYLFTSSQNRATQAAAERRAQDEALQAYLAYMSDFLLAPKHDQPSLDDESTSVVSPWVVARARTLTMLPRLDGDRKGRVVQFLYESRLIAGEGKFLSAPVEFIGRTQTQLNKADLRGANVSGTYLHGANLRGTDLRGAMLVAHLQGADLSYTYLNGADISEANLIRTDLSGADLSGADLGGTRLHGADLGGARLHSANLSGAQGWTEEQLDQAYSLEGATMPNGQQYGDWLKTPEGQDWLRKYKKNLAADKKRIGEYETWIKTTEGQMWQKAVGEEGENGSRS